MKSTMLTKRLVSALLLVCMLLGMMPVSNVSAAESWDVDGDGTLSIICIGNSFSVDAMQYVYQIADNLGITKIYLGNLYIGGCTLATHWTNASGDLAKYTYYKNTGGSWSSTGSYKMSTALSSRSWDYVSMQQASPNSGQESTYNSNLTNLVSYVKGKCPNSKLVWHMTWAYQGNSTHSGFANYNNNQTTMYNSIVSATKNKIVTNSNFSIVVPNGTAVQNARTSLIRDNLTRDGYHLNKNVGRYIAGLTFVKAITGLDISGVTYRAPNVPDGYHAIAIESATNAVATPYSVTTSAHTDVTTSAYYTQKSLSLKANSYWNSANATYYNKQITNASNSANYYSTQRFNAYTLPVGSVITLSSGWKYRPDAWLTNAVQTTRPGVTAASYAVCSDEWWANASGTTYLYRAFNISKSDTSALASNIASTINSVFKIYVPKEYTTSDLSPDQLYNDITNLADPIPNNSRVYWSAVGDISSISGKYLIVSDQATTGGSYYAWDPLTPRLFETWQATKVSVSSKSGTQRVYGADPGWGITFTYDATFGYADAGYSSAPTGNTWASFKLKMPLNKLDSEKLYLSNNVNYSSSTGFPTSLGGNVWRLQDTAFYTSMTAKTNSSGSTITNATWVKRFARANLMFNVDSDRFHFIWWPQFREQTSTGKEILIGDKTRRTSVRSMFADPATEEPYFYLDTSTERANTPVNYTCFFLYKIDTAKGNPEELYDKLKEAQKYINVDYTYFTTEYNAFLTALNEAYSFYNSKNGNASTQAEFDAQTQKLQDAITNLNAYNQIEFMSIPYTKVRSVTDAMCADGLLEGTYFISRYYGGNMDYVHSFINRNNIVGGDFGIVRYNVTSTGSYGVEADDLTHAITLRAVANESYAYTMQFENTNFMSYSGATLKVGNPTTFNFFPSENNSSMVSIYDEFYDYVLYCDAAETYDWSFEDPATYEATNRAAFRLYQCSPTTLELYRALQFIQPYCDQDEALKRYPSELYKQFLADAKSAMLEFKAYNTSGYFSNATAKTTCEDWAKKLRAWADTLTQADLTLSYIDIPVEVLDFKADGVMFEYDNSNYYGLVNYDGSVGSLPGSLYYYKNGVVSTTDTTGLVFRRGTTAEQLVDGKLVYKKETVAYVAASMLADKGVATTSIGYLEQSWAEYNYSFRHKMASLTELGTWERTLAKTSTGANGGDLDWNEITTAFDLAYYALLYLWREVPTTDENELYDGDRYNMKVPEREVLRLYKEETSGLYTFYSDNNMAYNGRYMYNTYPAIANPDISRYADFMPLSGLGFEAGGVETDTSGYYASKGHVDSFETDNFHYVVHAYGSFVYYEDQNLYFNFVGDDDVYFYVNNEIAMDLGGAHSAVGDTLYLNNFTMQDGSKLVDGEIYTFDMFYAERHTHAANMKFNTNIKIVDTDTLTTKGQYVEISGDADVVDSKTGMGTEMIDNGVVKVGDTVAYSFEVVNSHEVAIYDLIFEDKTLGTYLSKDIIGLTNEEITFTTTDITDIEVYYRTSTKDANDNITINSDIPVVKTLDEIKTMINTANTAAEATPGTSIPTGSYRVTMTSEQDLMDLMELGVPANCQIIVYGFKRLMVEEDADTTITNSLTMNCSYLPWGSGDTELNVRTLSGTASRILKVAALSGIPNATRAEVVIDYGKPLSIDVNGTISQASGVTNNGFVGFTASGYNGEFLKYAPSDLDNVFSTDSGTFTYRLGSVYYSLTDMISQVEKVYAVFSLTGCEFADVTGKAREYPYVLAEIRIIPATTVYYETDFDTIDFVGDNSAYTMIDLAGKESTYAIIDFESSDTTSWTNASNMTGTKSNGVLKGTISGGDPHIEMDAAAGKISYKLCAGDVVKMRIKSDAGIGTGAQVFFITDKNTGYNETYNTANASYTPDGDWMIVTIPINSAAVDATVTRIRIDPISAYKATGNFEIDWVYIGGDNDYTAWTGAHNMTAELADGVLKGSVTAGDPFIRMTCATCTYNHTITSSDVVKMRIKSDASIGTGAQVFFMTDQNANPAGSIQADNTTYVPNGEWQIITLNINSSAVGRTVMGIRIDPTNTTSAESTTGNFEIDWVYIGPDIADSSLFAYSQAGSTVFETTTTDAANPWKTEGTSETTLQTTTYAKEADTYGYDASYTDDIIYSNGSSLFVIGAGIPKFNSDYSVNYGASGAYTEVSFNFTGTGIDIISRTGMQQGALRVMVYDAQGNKEEAITVMNKGNLELYQIPVVSIEDLSYGEHTVKIFVNAPYENTSLPALNRGGEFYLDAVRIYNPVDTDDVDSTYAYSAYQKQGEANPGFSEVRNILIDTGSFNAGNAAINGVVYLDATVDEDVEFDDEDGRLTLALAEYKAIGPNNEVYLEKGKAIAFKLIADVEIPASVDIGIKSVNGASASVTMDADAAAPSLENGTVATITSCTNQNYPLSLNLSDWVAGNGEYYTYVIISNSGTDGMLSITDIKHAYNTAATALEEETETTESFTVDRVTKAGAVASRSVRYVVDDELLEVLGVCDHTYSYVNNGENHTVTCANCDYSATEDHNYVDGTCICGAVEVTEPKYEPEESLKFTMSISAGAEMTVTYNVMGADVNSYSDFYLEVKKDVAGGDPVTTIYGITEDREQMTAKVNPATGEALMYQVTYSGINAKEMGDNFSTTLYAVGEDGTIYYGETVISSIKDYLIGKIDDSASIAELKTMAVDMLKYGAAAQVRLGYNTENLVTADLTEEQLSYATQEIPEAVDYSGASGLLTGTSVNANIVVAARVQLHLSCVYSSANPDAMRCIVTDEDGTVLKELPVTNKSNIMFTAIYEDVGAKEMRDVINVTFYEGDAAISKTISWSVESYVAQVRAKTNVTEDELNMVNAMLTYGDAVAAYMLSVSS